PRPVGGGRPLQRTPPHLVPCSGEGNAGLVARRQLLGPVGDGRSIVYGVVAAPVADAVGRDLGGRRSRQGRVRSVDVAVHVAEQLLGVPRRQARRLGEFVLGQRQD